MPNILRGHKTLHRSSKPWPIKMVVWLCVAQGYSDGQIAQGTGLNLSPQQYDQAPRTRDTVRIIREEFYELDRPELVQAIHEEPRLMMLLRDEQILCLMARAFWRPAFITRIEQEGSITNFVQAIEDTIKALDTGYYDTRDGKPIERIQMPTWHHLKHGPTRVTMQGIIQRLNQLRTVCNEGLKDGSIKQVGTGWVVAPDTRDAMGAVRSKILADFEHIYPAFRMQKVISSVVGPAQPTTHDEASDCLPGSPAEPR